MIEVVGRARLQPRDGRARRDRELELAARAAERDPVDRGILRRHLDRDRIDVGGDRARRRPQPHRREGEQAGAGADIGDVGEARALAFSRSSASRQPVVVSCWPVPKARPASISNAIEPAGTASRWAGVWTKKRPARIGSSPCWLSVTQSSSATRSTVGRVPAALGTRRVQQRRASPRSAPPRNRRRAATRRRRRPRWSSAPAANRAARTGRYPPSAPRPRPWCRAG